VEFDDACSLSNFVKYSTDVPRGMGQGAHDQDSAIAEGKVRPKSVIVPAAAQIDCAQRHHLGLSEAEHTVSDRATYGLVIDANVQAVTVEEFRVARMPGNKQVNEDEGYTKGAQNHEQYVN
jgi:hypothetical protein